MKRMMKKLAAWLLCGSMVLSMPVHSLAAENQEDSQNSGFTWEQVAPEKMNASEAVQHSGHQAPKLYAEDEMVRVFIVFGQDPAIMAGYSTFGIANNAEALDYMDEVEESQDVVIERIEEEALAGDSLEVLHSFSLAANAVSAQVQYGDIEAIEEVEGVGAVYIVPRYELQDETADPNTTTAAGMVGSYSTWLEGYTGAGMRIAVIDTGLDSDHPSFDEGAFVYSLEQVAAANHKTLADYDLLDMDEIASVLTRLHAYDAVDGLTPEDVYFGQKVGFGFNYVDENLNITHDYDQQGDHGTHVSGIATANTYVPADEDTYVSAADSVMAVGIAPDAQLMTMKVFGTGGGAYADDYVAAIEDAILLGADAVNLSLGSGAAGFTWAADQWIDGVFANLVDSDTVVVFSAGNNGYWSENSNFGLNLTADINMATGGSPGTFGNSFTVASAENTGYTGRWFDANEGAVSVIYLEGLVDDKGVPYGNTPFAFLDTSEDGSGTVYEYVLLNGRLGAAKDFEDLDVAGKIVFIPRGELSFFEKANNAVAAGAAGVVIYNNTTGAIGLNLTGYEYEAPVVSIQLHEAEAIAADAAYDENTGSFYGTLVVYRAVRAQDFNGAPVMSAFSAWGLPGDLTLKPEITAPGGNIYSTLDDGTYGLNSGTSMAAPSVAGMTALVMQYIEENELTELTGLSSRALAQALLMGTAVPMIDPNSGVEYSVRQQGAGLANVEAAVQTPAYLLVDGMADGKVKAELGDDASRTGRYTFGLELNNMYQDTLYYELDESVLTAEAIANSGYLFMNTSDILLGADTVFTLENPSGSVYDLNEDDVVDSLDAMLVLQHANDKETLTEDQLTVADLDGDDAITTRDAQILLRLAAGETYEGKTVQDGVVALDSENKLTVAGEMSAELTVTITLTAEGKAYLENNYPNGGYVEGFVYADAMADEEGAVAARDLSVPFVAFYGNWTDSSMFERSIYLDDLYQGVQMNYTGDYWETGFNTLTNYFVLNRDGSEYYYQPNLYVDEATYDPVRNAISVVNGDVISEVSISLIRNAAQVIVAVQDAETEEIYAMGSYENVSAAYWSPSAEAWMNGSYELKMNWKGTDANGDPLAEGSQVVVTVMAVPEYFDELGDGVAFYLPLTIDNTAPVISNITENEDGTLTVTMRDNQYIAAYQLNGAGDTSESVDYGKAMAVNQTAANEELVITLARPTQDNQQTSVYNLSVVDYAGNVSTYRLKFDPEETYAQAVTQIILSDDSLNILKGSRYELTAMILPENVSDQSLNWTTADEKVAVVDASGVITATGIGTTTITATSVLTPEISASCEVTVFSLDVDLNAVLWDDEGAVNLVSFNVQDVNEYTKIAEDLPYELMAIAPVGDLLVAATGGDPENQRSDIYILDPQNNYEATYFTSGYWMTDMAYSPYFGQNGTVFGTYGPYLSFVDLATGTADLAIDVSGMTNGAYVVGITYLGLMNTPYGYADGFALMAEDGYIYMVAFLVAGPYAGQVLKGNGPIGYAGFASDSWYFDSLYYYYNEKDNEEYLFYSNFDAEDTVTLYAIGYDAATEAFIKAAAVDSFEAGIWPVSGLYMDSDLAISSIEEATVIEGRLAERLSVAEPIEFGVMEVPENLPVDFINR